MKHIAITLLILLACICAKAQNSYISFDKNNGGIDVTKCSIVYYDSEFEATSVSLPLCGKSFWIILSTIPKLLSKPHSITPLQPLRELPTLAL